VISVQGRQERFSTAPVADYCGNLAPLSLALK
jgi:hypothetical protein